jgi:hypothetical protein
MIRFGPDVMAAAFLSVSILAILGLWVWERKRSSCHEVINDDPAENIHQCPYCRCLCVDDQSKKVMICPVCKSYFDEEP